MADTQVKDPKDMSKEELLALHEEDLKTIDMLREKIARAQRNAPEFEPGSEVSVEALFDDKTLQENFSKLFKNVELHTLYDSTVNPKTGAEFHKRCDYKGPTIFLMFSDEVVFGVCCTSPWRTAKQPIYIYDHRAFFFVLKHPHHKELPLRFKVKSDHANHAFLSAKDYLPVFGVAGADLSIAPLDGELSVSSKPKSYAMKEYDLVPKGEEVISLTKLLVLSFSKKHKEKKTEA